MHIIAGARGRGCLRYSLAEFALYQISEKLKERREEKRKGKKV